MKLTETNIKKSGCGLTRKLKYQKNICCICGTIIYSRSNANIDHLQPLSKGGKGEWGNKWASHKECNFIKSARTFKELFADQKWIQYYLRLLKSSF